jgi:predicted nucleotidyltransferase component of viral defense system
MVEILSGFQKKFLNEIGSSELSKYFIWSGGTALSYRYLKHRKSYDLDFLSKDLLPDEYLLSQVRKIAEKLSIRKIEERKRFNRHEFWLKKNKEVIRIEFVFYPFSNIRKPKRLPEFKIKVDSIEDILTNKIHAIFERSEPKDIFDVYLILQKQKINFFLILKWVEKKFGVEIDPVLLVSKILEGAEKLKEIRPLILKKEFYQPDKIKKYFEKEVQDYLKRKIK